MDETNLCLTAQLLEDIVTLEPRLLVRDHPGYVQQEVPGRLGLVVRVQRPSEPFVRKHHSTVVEDVHERGPRDILPHFGHRVPRVPVERSRFECWMRPCSAKISPISFTIPRFYCTIYSVSLFWFRNQLALTQLYQPVCRKTKHQEPSQLLEMNTSPITHTDLISTKVHRNRYTSH